MRSWKEVVLEMVARKQLSAGQAAALVEGLRNAKPGSAWQPVAIIGISGRFPGARSVSEFWTNLTGGRSAIAEIPASRWDATRYYDPDPLAPGKTCCKWGGFLSGADEFDSTFFGIAPKEAQSMDPQQRLFLEECWHALEDAGYGREALDGLSCGVFAGAGAGDYIHQLGAEGIAADAYSFMGNANSILAARISYQLNLKGPSLAVDTACSSALTAIHLAAESLANGTCRMALAGGACILNTPHFFLAGSKAGMLSRIGKCRAFDRDADGMVPGEAVAVVVLKSTERALADGDHIYGIIEASAINQDGRTNGITAPSAPSQTAVETAAYRRGGVSPDTIGYVEAHGTGTRLGDPIEVEALTAAFRKHTERSGFCAIGSCKTNVGHTMSAAGAVGLIKILLSLQHRKLPPSLNFEHENEAIGFSSTPFFVPTSLQPWPAPESGPRRAALSSFGFSGTNVHMVVAEGPAPLHNAMETAKRRLFALSAHTPQALARRRRDLAQYLEAQPEARLDSVSYTLADGRTHGEHRAAFVAADGADLVRKLRAAGAEPDGSDPLAEAARSYVRGAAIAWGQLHGEPRPPRISLPGYPFERSSYRLGESSKPRRFEGLHPLLDEEISSGFAATFDRGLPFLRDHIVGGKHILPGACMLEMAMEAARRRNPGAGTLALENAIFHSLLVVEDEPRRVTIHLDEQGYRIVDGGEQVICTGCVAAGPAEPSPKIDLDELRQQCGEEIDMAAVAGAFRAAGVECGPFAGGLTRLWLGDGALGELRLPPGEIRSLHYYNLHPTLVDGAFQAAMALVFMRDPSPPRSVLVPAGVDRVTRDGPPFDRGYAFVQRKPEAGRYAFDIVLLDQEGQVVARLGNFQARELHVQPEKQPADEQPVSFYRPVWEPVPVPSGSPAAAGTGQATLIVRFPQDGGLGENLARKLEDGAVLQAVLDTESRSITPGLFQVDSREQAELDRLFASLKPLREVYLIAASSSAPDPLALLRVLKSLTRCKAPGPVRLKVVTAGAHAVLPGEVPNPEAAQVTAMALTFSREPSGFAVTVVDLGPEVLMPGHEWHSAGGARSIEWLLNEAGEPPGRVFAYRGEQRLTRVLALEPLIASSRAPRLRNGGVYVIVGGAGGLGLVFARHLAGRYRAHVLLLGRGELAPAARRQVEEMRALGGEVIYERADVTDRQRMREALDRARERWRQLNGVIHAAMVLHDVPIETMSEEDFLAVLAPKVEGSVVLAELLREERLDFLAFFSSAGPFFGTAGQANYAAASAFQDAFALSLVGQGRWPVRVVNWGFWGEVGAVARPQYRRNAARLGVGSIGASEGIEAFERALASEHAQVMAMKISMENLARLEIPARDPIADVAAAFDAVERHGCGLLLRYLQGHGIFLKAGERHTSEGLRAALEIVPRHARLWAAIVDILVRNGLAREDAGHLYTTELVAQPAEPGSAQAAWAGPFFKLLDACVSRYDEVLRGKIPATSVLFPRGSTELVAPLYGNNAIVDLYNRLVADVVHAHMTARQDASTALRVLEVGAGTGGSSLGVLELLLGGSAGVVEFHFTDLSPAFVQQAKARFARKYPFARFKLLNIEQEPASQGFEAGSFDIVVAANVLHATTRIADTLRHVRSVLKPGGILILNEAIRRLDFSTLTFGLTDGWWLPADPECRIPHAPLLSEDGWRKALRAAGFQPAKVLGNELPGSAQAVFVAAVSQSEDEEARAAVEPPDAVRLESLLAAKAARVLNLPVSDIDVNRRFAEYGVDSIAGTELVTRVGEMLGVNLTATILFDYPSVRRLAAHLLSDAATAAPVQHALSQSQSAISTVEALFAPGAGAPQRPLSNEQPARLDESATESGQPQASTVNHGAIAIVGISGRFPGASDVESFWRNLRDGVCSIREVPRERWDVREYYHPVPGTPGKSPCKWGGFLDDIDCFDPMFFHMSGAEAEYTDPQQRLFLQEAWKALEDAGYSGRWLDQRKCGVFVGMVGGDYVNNMLAHGCEPEPYAFLGNGASVLASRISYLLNLKGPALALDSACSSSLMAVHLASQSLASGECEIALAGGVFLSTTSSFHYLTGRLGMLSPSGQCRAFDDAADGFVPGEAVGAVVLRPLDAALRDGDHVYATILASGANQDGQTNGITAPSSVSQAELELEVYRKAGVDPETIAMVEAHGTGTRLGDPLEVEGLRQAFQRHTARTGFCALGSVKTNIGHASPAAGIASLIKVLLALQHGQIPPSLGFDRPNRNIDFEVSPFFVNRELRQWISPPGVPRRAAISSFGLSGTNVHLVVQEAPAPNHRSERLSPRLIPISARTPEALQARIAGLEEWLSRIGSQHTLTDIAYTLSAGRSHFDRRAAVIVSDVAGVAAKLRSGVGLSGPKELVAAAERYLAGEDLDWARLFAGDHPRRISLPTYPFARERYWLHAAGEPRRSAERKLHYFRREWRECAAPQSGDGPRRVVVVGRGEEQAVAELRRLLPHSEVLPSGGAPEKAIAALRASPASSYGLVLVQPLLDDCIAAASALLREFPTEPVRIVACHPPGQGIEERLAESASAFARPLALLRAGTSWSAVETASIKDVAAELAIPDAAAHPDVRYANGRREEKHSVPADLDAGATPPFRRGGVYWITGGAGALGRQMARYLVERYEAHVILTSRKPGASPVGPGETFIAADVSNLAQMREAAQHIRQSYGQIHGVIHAAGTIDPALLHQKTLAAVHDVFSPKISGAMVLDRVTETDCLDFFVLFASLTALAGDFGQCDYAVANRFLETFSEYRNGLVRRAERHGRTVAIHWPLWVEGAMHFPRDVESQYLELAGMEPLDTLSGCRALEACLASSLDTVAVVAGDAARILQLLKEPAAADASSPSPAAKPHVGVPMAAVVSAVRETTARVVKLSPERLGTEVCFTNFGLDSLNMKALADALSQEYGVKLSPTLFFQHQTIAAFSDYLCQEFTDAVTARHSGAAATAPAEPHAPEPLRAPTRRDGAIAIIGAAGRFPQSHDLEEFWEHLRKGDDLITEIPPERWDWKALAASPDRDDGKSVSHWGGFMPDLDKFDAAFFGISPREAAYMDPQHRIFLETVWTVIEEAGYRPSSLAGRNVGVFAGCQRNEYLELIGDAGTARAQAVLGNTHTMLANRVSFWFDFHGPSEAIDTACSSALIAVHRAVESLRNRDCEMAIAGGVSAILSPETMALASELGMLSPDGRCKTFDKSANGYVRGEGVGAVLLKPLDRALADGDHIHAVILATAENHGGRANFMTAPNPAAQARLLVDAYTRAGIDVRSVSCIEAHGTGTELGDPIEVDALTTAFGLMGYASSAAPFCGLGSVKSNIGHLEPAAGIAGLLKVVLAMRHRCLPRTLHVQAVNPYLKLADSPFYLLTESRDWEAAPRRAGVNSFGLGGSNAHVVLEEAPAVAPAEESASLGIATISAKTPEALRALVEHLCADLRNRTIAWRDLVFTLQTGREAMEERLAVEAAGVSDLLAKLGSWLADPSAAAVHRGSCAKTAGSLAVFDTPEELDSFVRREMAAGKWSKLARLWAHGLEVDWSLLAREGARRVPLPTYPFARTRHWFDRGAAPALAEAPRSAPAPFFPAPQAPVAPAGSVKAIVLGMLADSLYLEASQIDENASFTDLGLDSILAVELAKKIQDHFHVDLRATRLYDYSTVADLAGYLSTIAQEVPPAPLPVLVAAPGPAPAEAPRSAPAPFSPAPQAPVAPAGSVKDIVLGMLADSLYLEPSQIDENASFTDLGLDSIQAVELAKKIQDHFHVDLRATRLYDYSTVADLAGYISTMVQEAPPARLPRPVVAPAPVPAAAPRVRAAVASVLSVPEAGLDDNLDLLDLGFDTVAAHELSSRIEREFGISIPETQLLSFPSMTALSDAIGARIPAASAEMNSPPRADQVPALEDIAIIGLSGRFPGADNLGEFWANLAAGVDSVTEVPPDRWRVEDLFDPNPGTPGKTYCRHGGFLREIDRFDPLFFQISPQEAESMDPQQRIFLEESFLALEDAGYSDTRLSSLNCAVYVGVTQGDYFYHFHPEVVSGAQFALGNSNAILAARIGYFLNLKGPAVSVDTACSSSLVALHLACQGLRSGECELAIAGGVSVMTTPHMYQMGSTGRMLSAGGCCKTFDAAADGFVPAEGAAAVVLKPLSHAIRDGDRIHAVIRGSGINQDGKTNGITAPSVQSQKELELAVYERFRLDPSTFSYVEAHGTGTKLGDPIEMDALTGAFARYTANKGFCAIGSVKTNVGHCLPAAGLAGLLKVVLSMKNGLIPPSLHCVRENEHIDFAGSPFYVCRELKPWPPVAGQPRRAAVSSFGFSGTNAHVVVEEAPSSRPRFRDERAIPRAFCLSAKTPEALRRRAADLGSWLLADAGTSLDDISYTLSMRRSAFRHRLALVASTRGELLEALRRYLETGDASAAADSAGPVAAAAASWAAGATVEWSHVCSWQDPQVLSLPGYPFVRRRCWLDTAASPHAEPVPPPAISPRVRVQRVAELSELLRDHVVQGKPVFPAAAYLEAARVAAEGAEIRRVIWRAPFPSDGGLPDLTLELRAEDGHTGFRFKAGPVIHAEGEGYPVEEPAAPPDYPEWSAILAACPAEFPADAVNKAFTAAGISYGPSFRCLEWIRTGERDVIGKIAPRAASAQYAIHPGVLDAALRTVIGFALARQVSVQTLLPFALDRYRVYAPVDGPCYAHARPQPGDARFDVRIVSPAGKLLAAMEGFSARPLKTPGIESGELVDLYPVWRPVAPPAVPAGAQGAVIFHGPEEFGLAAALARVHGGARVVPIVQPGEAAGVRSEADFERALAEVPPLSRIYFLGLATAPLLHPDEIDRFQTAGVLSLFRLSKAIARREDRSNAPQLVVVTNNVHRIGEEDRIFPQAASLGGFARAFATEFPQIPVSIVDLEAGDLTTSLEALCRALAAETAQPGCDDIGWRHGLRFRRVLEPVASAPAPEQPMLRDRGVYIILGGMGGLGLTFARYLAAARRARLALAGRSALTEERRQHLRDLNALGAEAIYCQTDITDVEQLARLRAEVLRKWGTVNGVIDSAFLLRDQSLLRMDEARFREAFDPKARGTAAALWTFREDPLDWFALFSSAISFTSGRGQSNYAAGSVLQDALGLCWNATGKWPVRVVNWGIWGETGAVASASYRARFAALGAGSINEREGIAAFTRALGEPLPQRAIVKLARKPASEPTAPPEVREAEALKADVPAPSSMVPLVRSTLSEVLKIPAGDLDDEQPFEEYGIDSLVSMKIVDALEARVGKLTETILFEHNTIAKLAAFLVQSRPGIPPATVRSPAAIFPIRNTGSRQKSYWVHSVLGDMSWAARLAQYLGPEWPVFGFRAPGKDNGQRPYSSLEEIAAAYVDDVRGIQPHGPYILGGYSFGGSLAFEMARQLEQAGESISGLILLDAYAPLSGAMQSLARGQWDGFLPMVIANLHIREWGGSPLLTAGDLPASDLDAQASMAARHVRSVCRTPQSEEEIGLAIRKATLLARALAELLEKYQPRTCRAVRKTVLFRARHGFVHPDSGFVQAPSSVDDTAPDHGWAQWLAEPPVIHEVDADHFSLGLEPAIGTVGRHIAEIFQGALDPVGGDCAGTERARIFEVVKSHVLRVLPDVPAGAITPETCLKDLGANSLDRVEVATCAMEELKVELPRTRLAGADSVQSLVDILVTALPEGRNGS